MRELRILLRLIMVCSVVLGLWWIYSYTKSVHRAENPLGDPNFFAAVQVVALPLVLSLAVAARRAGRPVLPYYAAILIIAASIVSTISRGGLVTLLVLALVLAFSPAERFFGSKSKKGGFLAVGFLGLAVLLSFAWGDFQSRIENEAKYDRSGRLDLQRGALQAYKAHPVLGVGFGAFQAISTEVLSNTPGVSYIPKKGVNYQKTGLYAHNAYLGTLAELGPLGLVLFVAVLWTTWWSLVKTARRADASGALFLSSVANALAVGLLAFAVASYFLSSETSRALWFIVGMSLVVSRIVAEHGRDEVTEHGST